MTTLKDATCFWRLDVGFREYCVLSSYIWISTHYDPDSRGDFCFSLERITLIGDTTQQSLLLI